MAMGIIQREFIIIKLTSVENINHQISLQFIRNFFFKKKKHLLRTLTTIKFVTRSLVE